jgi:hypothetical protein
MLKPLPPSMDQAKAWIAAAIIWAAVFYGLLAPTTRTARPELWLIAAACP